MTYSEKVNNLLQHISKNDFSRYLEVSRGTFYKNFELNLWKDYQKEKIDLVYNEYSETIGDIICIKYKNKKMIITTNKFL